MRIFFFNKKDQLVKVENNLVEAHLIEQINTASQLTFTINQILPSEIQKACIPSPNGDGFLMFKILTEQINGSEIEYTCIESAYDELATYGYIKDLRPSSRSAEYILQEVLKGTRWELGTIYNTSNVSTNFYYEPILNCIQDVVEIFGLELTFTVAITGNQITARRVNMFREQGRRTGKRFEYGSNALEVEREASKKELYTALVGRGKGEEIEGDHSDGSPTGYGRRITFADIEWKKSAGDPLDKPKGQEYLEDPDATKTYGFDDGKPRIGIVTFEEDEDKEVLLKHTYQKLQELKRPKVQFKASVIDVGDCTLGDTVAIIRRDFYLQYFTRVFKIDHDLLDENNNTVELGDDLSSQNITNQINDVSDKITKNEKQISFVLASADGQHKVNYSPVKPTSAKNGDLWYKDLGNGETELYIYKDGWQLVISTEHQKEIDDAIEQAQKDTEAAKKQAQDAVDKANIADANARQSIEDAAQALSNANVVSQEVTQLKGGSTTTLAQLEDGLKQTITSGEFESYRAETAKLIQDKVSSTDFASYRSQTDKAIQDRVTSTQFESVRTQLSDQITTVVKTQTAENTNLIVNGAFKDGSYWSTEAGTSVGFYSEMNNVPISAGTYIRTMDNSASYSVVQRPSSAVIKALRGKTVTVSIYGRTSGTSSDKFRMYIRTTATDGTFSYINSGKYYTINNGWQRFSFTAVLPTDITAANITFNMQELSGVRVYLTGAQLNLSDQLLPYSESIEDFASQGQITVLTNAVNARVETDKLINQINISREGILIDGAKTHITNQTTIDNAVIKSAMIDTIKADQITTGTLNAANVNIINLNVDRLVGNTTNFVQSAWNNVSKYVTIDSSGISVGSGEASTELLYDGMHLYDAYKGEDVGVVRAIHRYGTTSLNGIAFDLNAIGDYMMWTARSDDDTKYKPKMLYVKPRATATMAYNKGFTFTDDVTFTGLVRPDGRSHSGFKFGTIRYHDVDYAAIYHPARQAGILFGGSNLLLMVGGTVMGLGGLIFPTEVSSDGRILHSAKL